MSILYLLFIFFLHFFCKKSEKIVHMDAKIDSYETFDIFSASRMKFWVEWTYRSWKWTGKRQFHEKSIIFLVFFDFLPWEVWLGETHVCLGETHVCLGETHVCLGETHVCLGETHVCLGETHVCLGETIPVLYPYFSLPVFFPTLFFLGLAYVFSKSPFPPIEKFHPPSFFLTPIWYPYFPSLFFSQPFF